MNFRAVNLRSARQPFVGAIPGKRKLHWALIVVFVGCAALGIERAAADAILYEGFDYPTTASTTTNPPAPGDRSLSGVVLDPPAAISLANGGGYTNPVTGTEWFAININAGGTTYNVAGDVDIVPGSLSYAGLPASTGNSVNSFGSGYAPRLTFPDVPATGNTSESNSFNGSLFYSALVRFDSVPTTIDGAPVIHFSALTSLVTNAYSAHFGAMFAKPNGATEDPNDFLLGISKGEGSSGGFAAYSSTPYTVGQTLFVVGQWQFVANEDVAVRERNDVTRLYINPTQLGGDPAQSGADLVTQDMGQDLPLGSRSINGIVIAQRQAGGANVIVDELRVGTTWASVTPTSFTPTGDFNGDGKVDGEDYLTWQGNYGQVEATLAQGDANDDKVVDDVDFDIWKSEFGLTNLAFVAGSPVPEPLALASCAVLVVVRLLPRTAAPRCKNVSLGSI